MHRCSWLLAASCCACCALVQTAHAATLGILGDSLSDEYAEQTYGAYSDNWVEQLVQYRGIDAGPTGAWGEPRRNFYEYNWARYGADSVDMLTTGQHTGLAAQVVPNSIDYAVVMIGANDQFGAGNPYSNIYSGAWSPAQITTWVNGVAANIATALNTVVPTGVELVLFNAPDYGVTPLVQASFPSAAGRQAVADVLANELNPLIEALAVTHQVPYVDLQGITEVIFGPHNALNATLAIGNVNINLMQSDNVGGTIAAAGFVDDGIHPHTVIQALIGNAVMEALNIGYGANLTLFSEQEILAHRGIAYGGSDTLPGQIGAYSDYITNYVPEPSGLVLAAGGGCILLFVRCRRTRESLCDWLRCIGQPRHAPVRVRMMTRDKFSN
jgi:lysophospholipase L1-like esterase